MRNVFAIVVGAMVLLPSALWAQQTLTKPDLDVAITYNAQRGVATSGSGFWAQGEGAELTANLYRGLGITADVTGAHTAHVSPSGVGLTLVTATLGPTYTWSAPAKFRAHKLRIFGQGLIGLASGKDSVFPSPYGVQDKAYSLAAQAGGGVDMDVSHHIAVRLLQGDWLRTQLPDGASNVENNLQIGAGVVFRLPK